MSTLIHSAVGFHFVKEVRITAHAGGTSRWLTLTLIDEEGGEIHDVTLFGNPLLTISPEVHARMREHEVEAD
jgi:hypothetical protein